MRFFLFLVVTVVTLLASPHVVTANIQDNMITAAPIKDHSLGRRFLRVDDTEDDSAADEERAGGELSTLKTVVTKMKAAANVAVKKTWLPRFFVWKYIMNVTPHDANVKLGIAGKGLSGRQMEMHKNWGKSLAYLSYYGKGPLKYDTLEQYRKKMVASARTS